MPCYSPLRGVKNVPQGVSVPCGRCIGCRLERARQWAVRIVHESKMHDDNSFLTLTYRPEDLPKDGSLSVEACQSFMKRLRSRIFPKRVRFFLCGEYGEQLARPHYHVILFGFWPSDAKPVSPTLFSSDFLDSVWGLGGVRFGRVTFESAAYVANYATKKITGRGADAHYKGRRPEFLLMSRRPGIGASWYARFSGDVFPRDEVIINDVSTRPPRFYDQMLEVSRPDLYADIKCRRVREASALEEVIWREGTAERFVLGVAPGNNMRRLAVREKVARAKLSLKRRSLESD